LGCWYCSIIASYYALRGGGSSYGAGCGAFYVTARHSSGATNWVFGAALSFKLSTHYTNRCGASVDGAYCGIFSVDTGNIASGTHWVRGAALLLVHIMLFVVAILEIMITAVHFIFMLTVMLLILIWALALLYKYTHYPLHGGSSTVGIICGAFYVVSGNAASRPGWDIGAALSFKFYFYL